MTDQSKQITIDDNNEITLPIVEILTGRGFITGKSGSGKSNTASVVTEALLDQGYPVMIVDTDGEYWGLKQDYELLHVGADEECDLQVGPEHAEKLAQLALEQNVPIILDVSGYINQDESNELLRETAHHLFAKEKKLKKPFLLLVEEVHEYIPESSGLNDTGRMLVQIAKRGRKHGLGLVGMSQRPASVDKDFITQANWIAWHRLTWDNDTRVVRKVAGKQIAEQVSELSDGECFLDADFLERDAFRVQIRRKKTFDAGATPGLEDYERPELQSVSGNLVDELEEISSKEHHRQDRIAELEAKLEHKNEEIQELESDLEEAKNMSAMAEQFTQALATAGGDDNGGEAIQEKIDEIREEKNHRIQELEAENSDLQEQLADLRETRAGLRDRVAELEEYEQAVEHLDELREGVERMADALGITMQEADEKLRKRLEQKTERIASLESQVTRLQESKPGLEPMEDYSEFLNADPVRKEIEAAKESERLSARYVKGVLASIIQEDGPVDYDTVAERLGLSGTQHVSKAASELESRKIITKDRRDDGMYVDLNVDGITEVRQAAADREKAEQLMEEL